MSRDAADQGDDSAGGSAPADRRRDRADDAHRARRARRCQRPRRWRGRRVRRATCRRSRAPAWTASRSSPRTRSAPAATSRRTLRVIEKVYTGQVPTQARRAPARRRDRHRRADAAGRRRGRDGRRNRACRRRRRAYAHAGVSAAERRPPGRGHRRRPDRARARRRAQSEPHRRDGRARHRRRRGLRQADGRDPLDRQRDRRSRRRNCSPARSTTSKVHAHARSSRSTAACRRRSDGAGHDRGARTGHRSLRSTATCWCFPAAARSASAI